MTTQQFQHHILPLKNKLFRYALVYLPQEADAKDVVQDVMMKAWEDIKDPKKLNSLEAWCITVTRNKCLDRLKKKGRSYQPIAEQYDLVSANSDPLQYTEAREIAKNIRQVIRALPIQQREAISLRDLEEYSYKEIAKLMQIDINHVKVLLHRARKEVKQQLMRVHNHGLT